MLLNYCWKNDLNQKGMVKLIGLSARSFFLHAGYGGSILNRKYPFTNNPPWELGHLQIQMPGKPRAEEILKERAWAEYKARKREMGREQNSHMTIPCNR